jgi:hypothetical protein
MDLIQIIAIFFIFYFGFMIIHQLRKKKPPDDPFKLWEMKVQIHCKKCGFEKIIDSQRFDYVCMKITDKRQVHFQGSKHEKCDGDVEVTGMWYEYKDETPAEKKWKEYEKRFR